MEPNIAVILIIVIVLVVGINGLLFLAARRGGVGKEYQLLSKAFKQARDPWQKENSNLEELSRLVSQFDEHVENDDASRD